MPKQLFNNLVKLGNNNPELRNDIKPVLHYLKDRNKSALKSLMPDKAMKNATDLLKQKGFERKDKQNVRGGLAGTFVSSGGSEFKLHFVRGRGDLFIDLEMGGRKKEFGPVENPKHMKEILREVMNKV